MKRIKLKRGSVRVQLLIVAVFVVLLGLYCYRLGGLPTGKLSAGEATSLHTSSSLHNLVDNPLFLPLNVLRYISQHILPGHAASAIRLPSVLFGLITITSMLYIVRRWYGPRTLLFSLLVCASSAWLLHIGRLGVNDIAYLVMVPALLVVHLLLYEYPENKWLLLLWLFTVCVLMYVPGGIWFMLLSIWWQRSDITSAFRRFGWVQKPLFVTLAVLLLAPLLYGALQHLSLTFFLTWLAIPHSLTHWYDPFKNLAAALLFVFVRTPLDPVRWLGRLPLLDAFLTVSFLAGCLFYIGHFKAERTRLLLSYGSLGLLLCAGGIVPRSVLVPLIYLVTFGGIAYILHQWLKLFPRNVLARRTGVTLVYVALILSCVYNLRHYFIAWPHNTDTKKVFVYTPPKK